MIRARSLIPSVVHISGGECYNHLLSVNKLTVNETKTWNRRWIKKSVEEVRST